MPISMAKRQTEAHYIFLEFIRAKINLNQASSNLADRKELQGVI